MTLPFVSFVVLLSISILEFIFIPVQAVHFRSFLSAILYCIDFYCLVYTVLCSCSKKPVRSAAVLLSVKQCVQWCV
nr:unnamed protein product [Callosobruchus analis]